MKKGDDVIYLRIRGVECRHALVRTPLTDDGPDLITALVMSHDGAQDEIGSVRSSRCIGAMAERAVLSKLIATAVYCFGRRALWAITPGRRRRLHNGVLSA